MGNTLTNPVGDRIKATLKEITGDALVQEVLAIEGSSAVLLGKQPNRIWK